ncbi:hypothetical protein HMPREF2533_00542 [Bacteroides fragilis]|nr:hypothetical protein HMPREF2530_00542 [Bacteroides fragilis]KXU50125.1 hypothetical protein HMPREF2533_00542 [Bacteroides fragilis]
MLVLIATIPFHPPLIPFPRKYPLFLYFLHSQSFFSFCFSSSYNLI